MARLLFLVPKLGSSRPTPGRSWPWICISFVLGRDQIKSLKQLVVAQIEEGKTESFHCSTIVVSYAYVWPCLVPAQGVDRDKTAHLAFAVDCRGRLSLPLPAGYFGSCVGSCYVEVGSGDTAGGDDDGFLAACEATGRTIVRLKEGLFDGAGRWLEKMSYVLANRAVSVAGSPKLKVYGVDFGWGRPEKLEMTSIRTTGAESPVGEDRICVAQE
ncbi:unnamed protein product [Musa acuminata subsp. malaccensis]|uniref:(wild Malaysian banana) hypothetical protein n=1 Tax=Musa acuminata subsp. malaccensis TaxID=214687 RepID=A0A804IWQ9_MUSAM|nr:PREDICTED: anthocyanin 5-aromatic acyltransferase-like [Musa acuminata subsp. malaccensis]CAG1844139.1 unnamed protein product [Musa acuminata subsp. malaccensis]